MTQTFADKLFNELGTLKDTSYKLSDDVITLQATTAESKDVSAKIYGLDYKLGSNSSYCLSQKVGELSYKIETTSKETYSDQKDELILKVGEGKLTGGKKGTEDVYEDINYNKRIYNSYSLSNATSENFNFYVNYVMNAQYTNIIKFNYDKSTDKRTYEILPDFLNLPDTPTNEMFSLNLDTGNNYPSINETIELWYVTDEPFFNFNFQKSDNSIQPYTSGGDIMANKQNFILNSSNYQICYYKAENGEELKFYSTFNSTYTKFVYYNFLNKQNYNIDTYTPGEQTILDRLLTINVSSANNFTITYNDGKFKYYNEFEDGAPKNGTLKIEQIKQQDVYYKYDTTLNITKNDAFKPYPALFITSDDITPPETYNNKLSDEINKIDGSNNVLNQGVIYTIPRFEMNNNQ